MRYNSQVRRDQLGLEGLEALKRLRVALLLSIAAHALILELVFF